MQEIHTPVRTLFFDLITGLGMTVYENGAVPDDAQTPYVILVDITDSEESNKSSFGNRVQILIDIVTSFAKPQIGGSKLADSMAGEILAVINSKTKLQIMPGLVLVNTKKIQDQKITQQSITHRIYRRLIRFSQLIMEV